MSDVPLDLSSLGLNSEPSPPIRYFDLLPPELVISIVEHASYPHLDSRRRRETLRDLCLTSRYLRSIAHPLLLSNVEFRPLTISKVARLVENNPSESLAMIRTISFEWPNGMRPPIALAQAAASLEALSSRGHSPYLAPFVGSNLKFLSVCGLSLMAQDVPCFRFQHLQYLEVSRCSFDKEIQFNLPSLRHLVYTPFDNASAKDHAFLDQIAPILVSVSIRIPTSLQIPLFNNPSTFRCYLGNLAQIIEPFPGDRMPHVLHLDTSCLANWCAADYLGRRIAAWTNLLDVSLRPEVLLLNKVRTCRHLALSVMKLEAVCRRRGIEVVWKKRSLINPTFTSGSAWFMRWAEERRKSQ